MFAHFIPHKGKGSLVFVLPLLTGIILFLIFDGLNLNDKYILPVSLLLSAFIIWFYDGGPKVIRDGFSRYEKSKNTLFWIEIKYWSIVLGIIGCVVLANLWENKLVRFFRRLIKCGHLNFFVQFKTIGCARYYIYASLLTFLCRMFRWDSQKINTCSK